MVKNGRAFVVLRPASTVSSAWLPQLEALLLGALAAVVLAALAAFFLARAIARPVDRVARASRRLVTEESPPTVPVEGPTELATLAESFNEMGAQLARAREAERNFLLSVSHELKTPLTAIRGYTEALADDAVSPEEAVEVIAREAERLDRLVHDLLDLARMKRSRFSVRREPVDLASAAREAVRRYSKQAEEYEVELEAVTPETAAATADNDRLLQVLSNLVENALRVTPAGGRVRVVAEPGRLIVEDSGPGLQPDELERAFERFFLYSRYRGQRSVGSGLGLAIVKELVESMGGGVSVESEPGGPTRFVVRLPHGSLAALGEHAGRARRDLSRAVYGAFYARRTRAVTGGREIAAVTVQGGLMKRKVFVLVALALLALGVLAAGAGAHRVAKIRGTMGPDALTGTPRADVVHARAGNDSVTALAGPDRIFAGAGDDSVDAGPGRDHARGGPGNDTLAGGDGNDRLRGRHGNDRLSGDAGNDRLWGGRGTDSLSGGEGDDVLHALANDDVVDTLDCGPGNDTVWLNANESDTHTGCETVKTVSTAAADDGQ